MVMVLGPGNGVDRKGSDRPERTGRLTENTTRPFRTGEIPESRILCVRATADNPALGLLTRARTTR